MNVALAGARSPRPVLGVLPSEQSFRNLARWWQSLVLYPTRHYVTPSPNPTIKRFILFQNFCCRIWGGKGGAQPTALLAFRRGAHGCFESQFTSDRFCLHRPAQPRRARQCLFGFDGLPCPHVRRTAWQVHSAGYYHTKYGQPADMEQVRVRAQ